MTRNFKILGLAVLALLAVGAFTASSASAIMFLTTYDVEGGKPKVMDASIEGNQEGSNKFLLGPISMTCSNALFENPSVGSDYLTLEPKYSSCKAPINEAHVNMNGCDYRFNFTKKLKDDEYESHFDIECPAGKSIEIKITDFGGTKTECTVVIPAQTSRTTVTLTNKTTAPYTLTIDSSIQKLKYTLTGATAGSCGIADGTYNNGEYTGSILLKAFNKESKQIYVEICGS